MKFLNRREVEIQVTGCDASWCQVLEANFVDNGDELTDEELLHLEEKYQEDLYVDWCSGQIDSACDMMEDR